MDGMALLQTVREDHPSIAVIMVTGYGTIESAVEAVRGGAIDFIAKPIIESELMLSIERARREHVLLEENMSLRAKLSQREGFGEIVGADYRMAKAFELIEAVAPSRATVLLTGESGTGKSMVAKAIHKQSDRAEGPFVEIHCGSMPESLLESELFGHVKGAFTGAHDDKAGSVPRRGRRDDLHRRDQLRVPGASGQAPPRAPGASVRARRLQRDDRDRHTRPPRDQRAARGPRREGRVPRGPVLPHQRHHHRSPAPARARLGHPAARGALRRRSTPTITASRSSGIEPEALNALQQYDFPGNVRELANFLERAVILASRPTITADDLPDLTRVKSPGATSVTAG